MARNSNFGARSTTAASPIPIIEGIARPEEGTSAVEPVVDGVTVHYMQTESPYPSDGGRPFVVFPSDELQVKDPRAVRPFLRPTQEVTWSCNLDALAVGITRSVRGSTYIAHRSVDNRQQAHSYISKHETATGALQGWWELDLFNSDLGDLSIADIAVSDTTLYIALSDSVKGHVLSMPIDRLKIGIHTIGEVMGDWSFGGDLPTPITGLDYDGSHIWVLAHHSIRGSSCLEKIQRPERIIGRTEAGVGLVRTGNFLAVSSLQNSEIYLYMCPTVDEENWKIAGPWATACDVPACAMATMDLGVRQLAYNTPSRSMTLFSAHSVHADLQPSSPIVPQHGRPVNTWGRVVSAVVEDNTTVVELKSLIDGGAPHFHLEALVGLYIFPRGEGVPHTSAQIVMAEGESTLYIEGNCTEWLTPERIVEAGIPLSTSYVQASSKGVFLDGFYQEQKVGRVPVYRGNTYRQHFISNREGTVGCIELFREADLGRPRGHVIVSLLDAEGNELSRTEVNMADQRDSRSLSAFFSGVHIKAHQPYSLTVTGTDGDIHNAYGLRTAGQYLYQRGWLEDSTGPLDAPLCFALYNDHRLPQTMVNGAVYDAEYDRLWVSGGTPGHRDRAFVYVIDRSSFAMIAVYDKMTTSGLGHIQIDGDTVRVDSTGDDSTDGHTRCALQFSRSDLVRKPADAVGSYSMVPLLYARGVSMEVRGYPLHSQPTIDLLEVADDEGIVRSITTLGQSYRMPTALLSLPGLVSAGARRLPVDLSKKDAHLLSALSSRTVDDEPFIFTIESSVDGDKGVVVNEEQASFASLLSGEEFLLYYVTEEGIAHRTSVDGQEWAKEVLLAPGTFTALSVTRDGEGALQAFVGMNGSLGVLDLESNQITLLGMDCRGPMRALWWEGRWAFWMLEGSYLKHAVSFDLELFSSLYFCELGGGSNEGVLQYAKDFFIQEERDGLALWAILPGAGLIVMESSDGITFPGYSLLDEPCYKGATRGVAFTGTGDGRKMVTTGMGVSFYAHTRKRGISWLLLKDPAYSAAGSYTFRLGQDELSYTLSPRVLMDSDLDVNPWEEAKWDTYRWGETMEVEVEEPEYSIRWQYVATPTSTEQIVTPSGIGIWYKGI